MTSFAYPPTMAGQHFDQHFSQESYSEYPQTSQPYPVSSSYLDGSFSAALTSIDSYATVNAFSEMPRQDSYGFQHDSSSGIKPSFHTYSPVGTEAEYMLPPRLSASSESGASAQSTSSSAMGSPHLHPQHQQYPEAWNPLMPGQGLGLAQDMTAQEIFTRDPFFTSGMEQDAILATDKLPGFVDPSILSPFGTPMGTFNYPDPTNAASPRIFEQQPPSPAPSHTSARSHIGKIKPSPHQSPYLQTQQYHPYASYPSGRRPSTTSLHSGHSHSSQRSGSFELSEEDREKGMCPIPDCGRVFKDLKAHMLTHQNERPEKCPIQTCEYHIKGFARKYDKNRHTLTHYKGTMVCGFCPGSGSAAEKSFNRADVFKRHLTSVHGVEQTAPNSRRKSPISGKKGYTSAGQQTTAGTCSTCSVTFANAQEFYEHLDDCVLRVVQQIDPAEGINQKNLSSVAEDQQVKDTLDRHYLPSSADYIAPDYNEDEEEDEEEFVDVDDANDTTYGSRNGRSGKGTIKGRKSAVVGSTQGGGTANQHRISKNSNGRGRAGLTFSKGGVAMHASTMSGRKKRKNYPTSWGCHAEKMKMKKRVVCVYDGPRRLWKDDMMLDSEFEVRMHLPGGDGKAYITDLDVQTMKRAEALHGATEDERGPWQPDNIFSPEE